MPKLKVGILGTGDVGKTLGEAFADLGHEVRLGSRQANNPQALAWATKTGRNIRIGTFADVAAFADIIVLATLGRATEDVVRLAEVANFADKIVLDTTNPLQFKEGQSPELFIDENDSLGERVQRLIPSGKVVKVFNTVGASVMVRPHAMGEKPEMFIAGNDSGAKKLVSELCVAWGWTTFDLGAIDKARLLESLVLLWIEIGLRTNAWSHAFNLVTRS